MKKLTQEQFEKRTQELLLLESSRPKQWFYCSFASRNDFLGAAIIEGHGIVDCMIITKANGINPGGEMFALPLTPDLLPAEQFRNRLLSKVDILQFWPDAKTIRELEEKSDLPQNPEHNQVVKSTKQ